MYEVIEYFEDLQDFNHPYSVGDVFPRSGMTVTEERLNELLSKNNRRNMQLIRRIDKEQESVTEEYSKTQISRMAVAELRTLAIKCNIADADNLTGGVLKKLLIEHFNL